MSKSHIPKRPTLFLGDSLTQFHDWRHCFGPVINFGIAGDTLSGVFYRMHTIKEKNPGQIFLMIGINDLLMGQPLEALKEDYLAVLRELKGCGKLFVLSVLPVIAEAQTQQINEQVIALNYWIRSQQDTFHFTYINLYKEVVETSSLGIKESYTVDGVHLSESAYRVWEASLAPFLF